VSRPDCPPSRLVLCGVLTVALALGACGRKGPLDAPPGAASGTETKSQQTQQSGNVFRPSGQGGLPQVKGEDKRIPLDVLLN
jgi:predicted small lipoprotein YifL